MLPKDIKSLALSSLSSKEAKAGSQGKKKHGGGMLLTGMLPLTYSAAICIQPRPNCPGVAPTTMGWIPLTT